MSELHCDRIFAEIDLEAARHNLKTLTAMVPGEKLVCSVIKANAYGHGAVQMAAAIDDLSDYFAVATVDEGIELREAGFTEKPILVLGSVLPAEYDRAIEYSLELSIFQAERAEMLNEAAIEHGDMADIHIAVDTGMSRIGLRPDETGADIVEKISKLSNINIVGAFTHFAKADETDKTSANAQRDRFAAFKELVVQRGIEIPIWHCANTAGIIEGIGREFDMVRVGISLYGLFPSDEVRRDVDLRPVMSFRSYITYIKEIEAGTEISYGGIFRAPRRMRIATVSAGYADGFARSISLNGGEVILKGKRCRILGRICMDQFMMDLTDVPDAKEGDIVTLMGRDGDAVVSAEEAGAKSARINYEVVCDISPRVPRVYI